MNTGGACALRQRIHRPGAYAPGFCMSASRRGRGEAARAWHADFPANSYYDNDMMSTAEYLESPAQAAERALALLGR
ncbi:hypothetical protein PWG14_24930, partial [Chromobacterium amazonense]|uniref:hypothetical protein n=1 Tax=Chromobacterium amazonense TaxID=1382803 RepID=UPI00237D785D